MAKKKEFYQGIILSITNYIWFFLMGNFYFWLMNIPFILIGISIIINKSNSESLILIITTIPMGPAFTALLSVMGRLIREGDVEVTKDFFRSYKTNFLESVFFWCSGIIILFIAYIDIIYLETKYKVIYLDVLYKLIIIILISVGFYIFPIISRFFLEKKTIVKLSFKYFVKKINITIIISAMVFIVWFISSKLAIIMIFFSSSIICYVIMFFQKNLLIEIEENLSKLGK